MMQSKVVIFAVHANSLKMPVTEEIADTQNDKLS